MGVRLRDQVSHLGISDCLDGVFVFDISDDKSSRDFLYLLGRTDQSSTEISANFSL